MYAVRNSNHNHLSPKTKRTGLGHHPLPNSGPKPALVLTITLAKNIATHNLRHSSC